MPESRLSLPQYPNTEEPLFGEPTLPAAEPDKEAHHVGVLGGLRDIRGGVTARSAAAALAVALAVALAGGCRGWPGASGPRPGSGGL